MLHLRSRPVGSPASRHLGDSGTAWPPSPPLVQRHLRLKEWVLAFDLVRLLVCVGAVRSRRWAPTGGQAFTGLFQAFVASSVRRGLWSVLLLGSEEGTERPLCGLRAALLLLLCVLGLLESPGRMVLPATLPAAPAPLAPQTQRTGQCCF